MDPITRLPPLTALRALEAIREMGSISMAARHLNVSHSAVSHQVSILQDWSPTPLFVRKGRRTELTAAGMSLAETTRQAFNSIRHEVDRLPIRSRQVVSIGAIPMLAQTWLTTVLVDLVRDMPEVSVHLGLALFDRPARLPPSLIISFANRSRLTHGDRLLFRGDAAPVCAPSVLAEHGGDPDQVLRSARRIHDEDSRLWRTWHQVSELPDTETARAPRISIEESSLIRAAALAGAGVAVCRLALVRDDLERGNLIALSSQTIDRDFFYFMRRSQASPQNADQERVEAWLLNRARKDRGGA
ncbi:LysR family transcriptional regulator [Rhodobacteraceae bacterium CCMM004]|nr:LysR family transcriptional regulator [Rhodobacteraceae bacterium CCMM004]